VEREGVGQQAAPASSAARRGRWRGGKQLVHEADVGNGQPQSLDPRQPFLVRKRRDLCSKTIESLVKIEHSPPFSNVSGTSLGRRGDASSFLRRLTAASP